MYYRWPSGGLLTLINFEKCHNFGSAFTLPCTRIEMFPLETAETAKSLYGNQNLPYLGKNQMIFWLHVLNQNQLVYIFERCHEALLQPSNILVSIAILFLQKTKEKSRFKANVSVARFTKEITKKTHKRMVIQTSRQLIMKKTWREKNHN